MLLADPELLEHVELRFRVPRGIVSLADPGVAVGDEDRVVNLVQGSLWLVGDLMLFPLIQLLPHLVHQASHSFFERANLPVRRHHISSSNLILKPQIKHGQYLTFSVDEARLWQGKGMTR